MPDRLEDLRRAFADANAPDLWPEIERRSELANADITAAPTRSMWRFPALAAAAVLVVAGLIAIGTVPGGDDEQVAVTSADKDWMTLHVPILDWRLEHPAAWSVQLFEHQCKVGQSGAVITNRDRPIERARIPDGCTTGWDLSDVPSEFVGVEVSYIDGGPPWLPDPSASDTPRPLRVEDFDRIDDLAVHQSITIAGESRYGVLVWIGPDASASDVAAVERVVGSIIWTSD